MPVKLLAIRQAHADWTDPFAIVLVPSATWTTGYIKWRQVACYLERVLNICWFSVRSYI